MKTSHLAASVGLLVLSVAFASPARAACGSPTEALLPLKPISHTGRGVPAGSVRLRPVAFTTRPGERTAPDPSIVGLWLSSFTVGGQPFFQAFESFDSDGLETLNDNGSPSAGNVCLGVWAARPSHLIKVKHPSWSYDDQGTANGIVVIGEEVKVDERGTKFEGTFTVDVYDNNAVLLDHVEGEVSAKRITAE